MEELPRSLPTLSEALRGWLSTLTERGREEVAFGLYGLAAEKFHLLIPRKIQSLRDTLPKDKPSAWKRLDVNLLHRVILREMLGIDSPEKEKECLEYSPDGAEVLRRADAGMAQLTFFLNPMPISSVLAVANAGVKMPPKSTYFYPKTPAGLVINPLWDE
jgi:uncharacterized protein (DUF1015 family)